MKELIMEEAERIAEEYGFDIDTLNAEELNDLYILAESKAVDNLADMKEMRDDEKRGG